jgi:hypothetical protein
MSLIRADAAGESAPVNQFTGYQEKSAQVD